jgi:hypothetical protein
MQSLMTYILQSVSLSQEFIQNEMENCLNSLYDTNEMVFDYWLSELFDDDDVKIQENWNETNLREMYKDVDSNRIQQLSELQVDSLFV